MPTFTSFIASLPRHQHVAELDRHLGRLAENGATGIWIENDYLRWDWINDDGDSGFGGNWRLFNIFDFTRSRHRARFQDYLHGLIGQARRHGLGVYGSFWLPKLNRELETWLRAHKPDALGSADYGSGNQCTTWCSCADGAGIALQREIYAEYLAAFPELAGLKVAIKDNSAFVCTRHCRHAHGDDEASNAARIYRTMQEVVQEAGKPRDFLCIYPWFWDHVPGMEEAIAAALEPGYRVITKYASELPAAIETDRPASCFIDATLLADRPGPSFLRWRERVGGERLLDMTPQANSMDLMFVAGPPLLALAWERWAMLAGHQLGGILDFDCSGSPAPSTLHGFRLFQERPELRADVAVAETIRRSWNLSDVTAASLADGYADFASGWKAIPLALGEKDFSARFGEAWPMTLATPLVRSAFAAQDQGHRVHWFSPYNFFRADTASRLQPHFARMLASWSRAELAFAAAAAEDIRLSEELQSVQACVLCVRSALTWCSAAACVDDASFASCVAQQLGLVQRMQALVVERPDLWENNCWHPHQTVISQRHVGFLPEDRDAFVASQRIMSASAGK
jgi:hypothetical protein